MYFKQIVLGSVIGLTTNMAVAALPAAVPASDLEIFFGAATGSISAISPSTDPAIEGSGILSSFEFVAGDMFSFDYNFLTNERPDQDVDDFAFGSFGGVLSLLDHSWNPTPDHFVPSLTPYNEETGYINISFEIPTGGIFDFGLGIVDASDSEFDSALLVDNVKVIRGTDTVFFDSFEPTMGSTIGDVTIVGDFFGNLPTDGSFQALITTAPDSELAPVPLPAAVWFMLTGLGALSGFGRKKHS